MTSTPDRDVFPMPEMGRPRVGQGAANAAVPAGGAQMLDDRFPVELIEGVPVLATPEEIDITNAEALRSALLTAAANGHRTLVVDMTQTTFCDSSALHTLLAAHTSAEAEGREVLLVIASTPVLRVLALTGIDHMIPHFTSLPEALAYTGRRDHQPSLTCEAITSQAGRKATDA